MGTHRICCPECRAELTVQTEQERAVCPFCGTEMTIPPELRGLPSPREEPTAQEQAISDKAIFGASHVILIHFFAIMGAVLLCMVWYCVSGVESTAERTRNIPGPYIEDVIAYELPEEYLEGGEGTLKSRYRHTQGIFPSLTVDMRILDEKDAEAYSLRHRASSMDGETLEKNNREVVEADGLIFAIEIEGRTTEDRYFPEAHIRAYCELDKWRILDIEIETGESVSPRSLTKKERDLFVEFVRAIRRKDESELAQSNGITENMALESMTWDNDDVDAVIKVANSRIELKEDLGSEQTYYVDKVWPVVVSREKAEETEIEKWRDEFDRLEDCTFAVNRQEAMSLHGLSFVVQMQDKYDYVYKEYSPNAWINARCVVDGTMLTVKSLPRYLDRKGNITEGNIERYFDFLNSIYPADVAGVQEASAN